MIRIVVLWTATDGTLILPRLLFHGFSRELRRVFLFALTSSGSSIPVAWMSSALMLSFILCTFKI